MIRQSPAAGQKGYDPMSITTKRVLLALLAVAVVIVAFVAAYNISLRLLPSQTDTPAASSPAGESETAAPAGQTAAPAEQTALPGNAGGTTGPAEGPSDNAAGETTAAPENPAASDDPAGQENPAAPDPAAPTYIGGVLIVNKTYPLPRSYGPGGLTDECESAFEEMQEAAAEEGLDLYVASGFRSYELQASLYQRYCDRDGKAAADTYSARPGHSEHQTGLAIDLNSISSDFAYTAEGQWVGEHCWEYGFILRYPADKVDITGYMYEPWHIRYLGRDTAKAVYESGLCLEEYLGVDSVYQY